MDLVVAGKYFPVKVGALWRRKTIGRASARKLNGFRGGDNGSGGVCDHLLRTLPDVGILVHERKDAGIVPAVPEKIALHMDRKRAERKQLEPGVPVLKEMLFRFIVSADSEKPFPADGGGADKQICRFHAFGGKALFPQIFLRAEADAVRVCPRGVGMLEESQKQFFGIRRSDQIVGVEKNKYIR